ncbi:PREDICTED: uncharacterized protein LOC108374530 [Rhagoletis zephyria]|uniref:uncharacterized protein LOC108374530 n=1 Tax=Rhagoletis zephyria TaxID=28612 RepID=UPI0008114C1C|nr:PREDICTED: uncharacterized protein LOC108374530 [Rhagoletis zephyria]
MELMSSDSRSDEAECYTQTVPLKQHAEMRHNGPTNAASSHTASNSLVGQNVMDCVSQTANHRHLTRNQLAARTSVGKELPKFSGRPEEWPLFLATYNQTTEICGFSQDESVIRLRKDLEGAARQSVKNLLLYSECGPQIISTLKMKFGRPELIINVLLDQIRNMPPQTTDNLESLVNFALEVQNVCASNPELEQKLVSKLPAIFQAFWGMHKLSLTESNLENFSKWLTSWPKVPTALLYPIRRRNASVVCYIFIPRERRTTNW